MDKYLKLKERKQMREIKQSVDSFHEVPQATLYYNYDLVRQSYVRILLVIFENYEGS